jgi:endonuclease VIII
MPEGPETKIISDFLNKNLSGKTLLSIEINSKSRYYKLGQIEGYDTLLNYLPLKVSRVWTRGKVIVFELQNDIYITSQLGMEGWWNTKPGNHSGVIFNFGFQIIGPINLNVIEDRYYYDDSRHMGNISIYMSQHSLNTMKFKSHGPDLLLAALINNNAIDVRSLHPLQIPMSYDEWVKCIKNKRVGNKIIAEYLHDQKKFSGIGNYCRAHIMYLCRISPFRKLSDLTEQNIYDLYVHSLNTLYQSYMAKGLTVWTYMTPEGEKGSFEVLVYNKTHDPYGNPVQVYKDGKKQSIHWVPNMQI